MIKTEFPSRFKEQFSFGTEHSASAQYEVTVPHDSIDYKNHDVLSSFDVIHFTYNHSEFPQEDGSLKIHGFVSTPGHNCHTCGEYMGYEYDFDNDVFRATTVCQAPEGGVVVVDVPIPSGKIVIADHLRNGYDIGGIPNGLAEHQTRMQELVDKYGMGHGVVSNNSPTFYRTGEGDTYAFANWHGGETECENTECELYDEETETCPIHPKTPTGWEEKGGVCTDLWAFSFMDYEKWKTDQIGLAPNDIKEEEYVDVVDVAPGTYRLTYYGTQRGFNVHDNNETLELFATVELMKE